MGGVIFEVIWDFLSHILFLQHSSEKFSTARRLFARNYTQTFNIVHLRRQYFEDTEQPIASQLSSF